MERPSPEDSPKVNPNDVIRKALASQPDMIDVALSATEGDHTEIITDARGVAREVTFVAPEFPETYEE